MTDAERIAKLEAENASLRELVKAYMDIAAHWGTVNAQLRKELKAANAA